MAAGPKRHRITIQQDRPARGPDGGPIENYVTLATVWAEAVTLKGAEKWAARQVQGTAMTTWRVRYGADLSDLSGSIRVLFKGRAFHAKDITTVNERNWEIDLTCEEATDSSEYPLALADTHGEPLLDPNGGVLQEP